MHTNWPVQLVWKSLAQTPAEASAAPEQPGLSPAASCSPPAEPGVPLVPEPAPPHTDISSVPAPHAPTAAMRSVKSVEAISLMTSACQVKVKRSLNQKKTRSTSCVSWLVCWRMWLSCSSSEPFCWSSSSKASWTFWRWDWSRCSSSFSFATSSCKSCRDRSTGWPGVTHVFVCPSKTKQKETNCSEGIQDVSHCLLMHSITALWTILICCLRQTGKLPLTAKWLLNNKIKSVRFSSAAAEQLRSWE